MVLSTLPMHCPPSWTVQIQALPPDLCLMPVAFCLFFFFCEFQWSFSCPSNHIKSLVGWGPMEQLADSGPPTVPNTGA